MAGRQREPLCRVVMFGGGTHNPPNTPDPPQALGKDPPKFPFGGGGGGG